MKILALPHGIALAHVTRPLEVARALREDGHEVAFACSSRYDRFVTERGFTCRPILTEDPARALARVREGRRYRDDDEMLARYVEAELEAFARERPDVVLGDFRPSLSVSTELVGLPYVTITNALFTRYYAAEHPPPETLPLTRILGRRIAGLLVPRLQRLMLYLMAGPIRRYRRREGMPPVRNMLDILESPTLNLIADIPEFGPTRDLPPRFRYVGPIMWEAPLAAPEWLGEVNRGRPALYVTLGSTGEANGVGRLLAEALGGQEFQVMMTTGAGSAANGWPANFRCAPFAPGCLLAERADLVVCHGGNGTIYQALSVATPVLGLPTFFEQEYHMDRVEALGAGRKLVSRRLEPDGLAGACRAMLAEPSYAQHAAELAVSIRACDAPRAAADLIESLGQGGAPNRP